MQQTIYAPYLRTSPLHIPRRDLVLAPSDSLYLRVTIVESDKPDAQLLVLTGGLDGPQAQLTICIDHGLPSSWYDYQHPAVSPGMVMWSVIGEPQVGLGSFDFALPSGTFTQYPAGIFTRTPLRYGWCVQLNWDAVKSDVLFTGILNVSPARFGTFPPVQTPVLTDDDIIVLA